MGTASAAVGRLARRVSAARASGGGWKGPCSTGYRLQGCSQCQIPRVNAYLDSLAGCTSCAYITNPHRIWLHAWLKIEVVHVGSGKPAPGRCRR